MKKIKEYFNNLFQDTNKVIDLGKVKELEDTGLEPVFILNNKYEGKLEWIERCG